MAKGGARPGAGRPKGSTRLSFASLVSDDERKKFVEFVLDQYMGDMRLAVWMGDQLFGKASQAIDVTSGGEVIGLSAEDRARLDALIGDAK